MASLREILFWQTQADAGKLLSSIRCFRRRAIRFFGSYAVLAADERKLLTSLEAHMVAAASDQELLHKLNRIWDDKVSQLSSCEDIADVLPPRPKLSDAAKLKRYAKQHLCVLLGR